MTQHTVLVPPLWGNRSNTLSSDFVGRLVFSERLIRLLTIHQHRSKRISSPEMSKASEWISANHQVPTSRLQLNVWKTGTMRRTFRGEMSILEAVADPADPSKKNILTPHQRHDGTLSTKPAAATWHVLDHLEKTLYFVPEDKVH